MQQRIQNLQRVSSMAALQKQHEQNHKNYLWKQLPSLSKQGSVETFDIPSKSSKATQDPKNVPNLTSQVPPKKKQRRPSISNFLKFMQVEINNEDTQSKFEGDSQVISVLDIKYSDSFYTQKQVALSQSILADRKFRIYLLISGYRQSYISVKDSVITFFNSYLQQQKIVTTNIKKLLSKYETQMSTKTMQIKNLQLQLRQQRLTTIQQKYRIDTQVRELQQKLKQTQQKLYELQIRLKQQQQQSKQIKIYNKQLNQLMMKSHKKIQELQNKCKQIKQYNQNKISVEVKKIQQKYQNLLKQQIQSYQLKLQNLKIKFINYIDFNTSSKDNGSIIDPKDLGTINKIQGHFVGQLVNNLSMGNLEKASFQFKKYNKQTNEVHNYLKLKQQDQERDRIMSSPKSTSARRFARTSKPHLETSQNCTQRSTANQNNALTQNVGASQRQTYGQEKKLIITHRNQSTQNLKDNQNKNGFPLYKPRFPKDQSQPTTLTQPHQNNQNNTFMYKNSPIKKHEQARQSFMIQFSQVLDQPSTPPSSSRNTSDTNKTFQASIQAIPNAETDSSIKMNKYVSRASNNYQISNNVFITPTKNNYLQITSNARQGTNNPNLV